MALQLGDVAPDFTQQSTRGRSTFTSGSATRWGVLFSHPKTFTPVCTTELGVVAKLKPEFDKRNVKVIGLTVDPVEDHEVGQGHRGDAGGEAQLPAAGRRRREGVDAVRHDPPERQRHDDGALGLRHRARTRRSS